MTLRVFCKRHSISRSMFYLLKDAGQAPRIMRVGRKILITQEAAAEWREQMEAKTSEKSS